MILHLVRHGQTDWNVVRRVQGQTESQLDETGRKQASELGKKLRQNQTAFTRAHISSSVRTRQTADGLFGHLSVPQVYADDLREMRLGRWETLMWDDIELDEPEMFKHYKALDDRFSVDGAETLVEMQQRGVAAVERIIMQELESGTPAEGNIAIVSHGFLLRAVFAHYLRLPLKAFAASEGLPNCAHSIIKVNKQTREVISIAGESPERSLWKDIIAASRG